MADEVKFATETSYIHEALMTMRINDFIGLVLKKIKNLPTEKDTSNILVHVDSMLAYDNLCRFLEKHVNSEQVINNVNLRQFFDFLADRWYSIKNTDAIYSHHPNT